MSLIIYLLSIPFNFAHAHPQNKQTLYMAASLFNAREARFNLDITRQFEALGYQAILPQRDGFEYKSLSTTVKKYSPANEIAKTARDLIYLLDMGVFIPESDVIVANLDEPVDDGVIIEIAYAHMMGKPVIGYRTDLRTPFGSEERLAGLHSFVAFQCDYIIVHYMKVTNAEDEKTALRQLVSKIDQTIKTKLIFKQNTTPNYVNTNPQIEQIIHSANRVLGNAEGIHTQKGLEKAIKKLIANQSTLPHIRIIT